MSAETTRMQNLASEFSKKFPGVISPDPHSGRGDPLPHSPSSRPLAGRGCKRPGPKPWSPSTFQPWLRPWIRGPLTRNELRAIGRFPNQVGITPNFYVVFDGKIKHFKILLKPL